MTEEFVRSMFRGIDARDWDTLARHFHPALVYQRPGFPLLEGRDAVVRFYREVREIQGEHRLEEAVARVADLKLRRMHTHREPACVSGRVVAEQRPLPALVQSSRGI